MMNVLVRVAKALDGSLYYNVFKWYVHEKTGKQGDHMRLLQKTDKCPTKRKKKQGRKRE